MQNIFFLYNLSNFMLHHTMHTCAFLEKKRNSTHLATLTYTTYIFYLHNFQPLLTQLTIEVHTTYDKKPTQLPTHEFTTYDP